MPSLPVYNSQEGEVPVKSSAREAQATGATDLYKDNANVIDALQYVTGELSKAHDVMQETKAKTAAETAYLQQEQAAFNDPNPDNAEMHIKAINDIASQATNGIDNQELAGRVGLDLQHSAFLSQIKIQDEFRRKQMVQNSANVLTLADTTAKNVANAVSPAQAQQDEDNFMETIRKQQYTRLLSPAEGEKAIKEYKIGVVKNKIAQNNSTNSDDYKDLTDGLDLQESTQAQKMIDAHIKQLNERNISNTFDNRVNILKGIATKQLDWTSTDKINEYAKKDPALGSALQMVFDAQVNNKSEYEPTSKEGEEYANSVNQLMTSMTKEQVSDYLPKAIEQISKLPAGEMQDRLAVLVNAAQDRAKGLPIKDEQEIPSSVIQQEGGIQAVLRWNKEHGDNDPQTVNEYLKNIHSGQSPSEAYNNAVKTKIIKDHPEVAAQKDVPNRIVNNDSKSFHIFTGETKIYPARIWNEKLGRFEINPNREESNDNSAQQTNQ